MTHLNPLHSQEELSSTIGLPEQDTPSVRVDPGKQIPKLYDIAFTYLLGELNKVPLSERVIEIQNTPLTLDIKMRFLQPAIEQKLREAKTDDAILVLFQEIKNLCSAETVFDADIFNFYMKPLIQKVAGEQYNTLKLKDFSEKTKAFSEDTALSEMFGLWYVFEIQNQEELSVMFQKQTFITRIKVTDKIGDEGARDLAEALKVNKTLTSLNLYDNKIEVEGAQALAEALKENRTLTGLYLGFNQLGDEGARDLAEALKVNKTLTRLHLGSNQIRVEGARDLAEALKVNRTLISLNLEYNQIGIESARAIAQALKENETLTSLNLEYNNIGIEIVQLLQEMCTLHPTKHFQF